jgi:hypothetical protein
MEADEMLQMPHHVELKRLTEYPHLHPTGVPSTSALSVSVERDGDGTITISACNLGCDAEDCPFGVTLTLNPEAARRLGAALTQLSTVV